MSGPLKVLLMLLAIYLLILCIPFAVWIKLVGGN